MWFDVLYLLVAANLSYNYPQQTITLRLAEPMSKISTKFLNKLLPKKRRKWIIFLRQTKYCLEERTGNMINRITSSLLKWRVAGTVSLAQHRSFECSSSLAHGHKRSNIPHLYTCCTQHTYNSINHLRIMTLVYCSRLDVNRKYCTLGQVIAKKTPSSVTPRARVTESYVCSTYWTSPRLFA